jgi:(p)ppGpp synthase/HD superfamily hydrolase
MHFTDDEDVLTAAVLNDTVEDTAVTIQRVEKEFGPRVAELVASVTEDKKRKLPPEATWRARKW